MLAKIKRDVAIAQFPKFPQVNEFKEEYYYPETFRSYTLIVESKSIKGHAKQLSKTLKEIFHELGLLPLTFLGDTTTAWLYQENDYKPVKEAMQYLSDNKVGRKFNGALQVEFTAIEDFFYNLFWLARCNAAFPDIRFTDKNQNVLGHICKYGNVHLDTMDKEFDAQLIKAVNSSNFIQLENNKCTGGKIMGRQTIV